MHSEDSNSNDLTDLNGTSRNPLNSVLLTREYIEAVSIGKMVRLAIRK